MALQVREYTLTIEPGSLDGTRALRVYHSSTGPANKDSEFLEFLAIDLDVVDGLVVLDMEVLGVFSDPNALYSIGVTKIDALQNESNMVNYSNFQVDYAAPTPVLNVSVDFEVV